MKKLNIKKLLKLSILSIVLMLPIFAALSKIVYVSMNKNAYQSYSDTSLVLERNELDNVSAISENTIYYLNVNFQSNNANTLSYRYYYSSINVDWTEYGAIDRTYYSFKLLRAASNNNQSYYIWLYYTETDLQQISILNANMPELVFTLTGIDTTNSDSGFGGNLYTYIFKQQKLDNVFYYANDQVWEQDMFSWVSNSPFTTNINNFIAFFGITNDSYFNNLITYWISILGIYLVLDLILITFDKLAMKLIKGE